MTTVSKANIIVKFSNLPCVIVCSWHLFSFAFWSAQDDEYLAALQADREKELRAMEEEKAAKEAALMEQRRKEEESQRKLQEEQVRVESATLCSSVKI